MADLAKVKGAIGGLVTLKIVTGVTGNTPRQMETTIDLIQGDITNTMSEDFVTGDLKELRAFHETQVLKGQQIIKDNIEILRSIYHLLVSLEES